MKKIIQKYKSIILFTLAVVIVASSSIFTIFAKNESLSPGMEILASRLSMVKTGLSGGEIVFSEEDFEALLGSVPDSIVIKELPALSDGVLKLGALDVTVNQIIAKSNLGRLRFLPAAEGEAKATFRFQPSGVQYDSAITCTMYVLTEENRAPAAEDMSLKTYRDIAAFSTFRSSDPENDVLTFSIVKEPKKGVVTMTDASMGTFTYQPYSGKTGKDTFTYMITDQYGNRSAPCTVNVNIEKRSTSVSYLDLDGHWACNAAVRMAEENIMIGEKYGDTMLFYPDKEVTRGEFLMLAMNAAGYETNLLSAADTGFADDADIPTHMKSYVSTACRMGIINGTQTDEGMCFLPNETITRAEAAVMINAMLKADQPEVKPVFADMDSIPTWSMNAIYALNAVGIIGGTEGSTLNAGAALDRAQTAQLLCGMMDAASS